MIPGRSGLTKWPLCEKHRGFTLIEVIVALVILGLVMGGLYSEIQSQIDRRYQMQERYFAQTVAWNRLLSQYQILQRWAPRSARAGNKSGEAEMNGRDWYWEMEVQETLGEDFYRYEVKSFPTQDKSTQSTGSLAAYFVAE